MILLRMLLTFDLSVHRPLLDLKLGPVWDAGNAPIRVQGSAGLVVGFRTLLRLVSGLRV